MGTLYASLVLGTVLGNRGSRRIRYVSYCTISYFIPFTRPPEALPSVALFSNTTQSGEYWYLPVISQPHLSDGLNYSSSPLQFAMCDAD